MFYWVVKGILTPILKTLFRPWIEGAENIPEEGPAIIPSTTQTQRLRTIQRTH